MTFDKRACDKRWEASHNAQQVAKQSQNHESRDPEMFLKHLKQQIKSRSAATNGRMAPEPLSSPNHDLQSQYRDLPDNQRKDACPRRRRHSLAGIQLSDLKVEEELATPTEKNKGKRSQRKDSRQSNKTISSPKQSLSGNHRLYKTSKLRPITEQTLDYYDNVTSLEAILQKANSRNLAKQGTSSGRTLGSDGSSSSEDRESVLSRRKKRHEQRIAAGSE